MKLNKIFSFLFIMLAWANATASDDTNTEKVTHRSVSAGSTKLSAVRDLEDLIKTRYTQPGNESRRKEYLMDTIKQYRAVIGDYSIGQNDSLATLCPATLQTLAIGTLHQMRDAKGIDLMSDYSVTRAPSIASTSVNDWIEGVSGASPSPNKNARNTADNNETQTVSPTTLPNEQNSESELMKKNNPLKLEANGKGLWATVSQGYGTAREYVQQYPELTIIAAAAAAGVIFGRKTAHPLQITLLDAMRLIFSEL